MGQKDIFLQQIRWIEVCRKVMYMIKKNSKVAFLDVKNVASTMAIEEMYVSKDFINKMILVASGELSSEQVRQEIISQYARH